MLPTCTAASAGCRWAYTPPVSLALPRERLKTVHGQVAAGVDPALARLAADNLATLEASQTVEGVARERYGKVLTELGREPRQQDPRRARRQRGPRSGGLASQQAGASPQKL